MDNNQIQIYKLLSSIDKHEQITTQLNNLVNYFGPILKQDVNLPKVVNSLSAELLFSQAALIRGFLDTVTTYLLSMSLLKLQIKIASRQANEIYKIELLLVYKADKADVSKARGFDEKELLACSYIDSKVLDDKKFWEHALSDADDIIDMLKLKMQAFKGALDTILNQAGLLNIACKTKGLVLDSNQMSLLENLKTNTKEGETSLTGI